MSHTLVVIHTASTPMEAALIKSRLEAEGIPVYVSQEGAATAYGLAVGPLARADILVPDHRADEARAIIADTVAGPDA